MDHTQKSGLIRRGGTFYIWLGLVLVLLTKTVSLKKNCCFLGDQFGFQQFETIFHSDRHLRNTFLRDLVVQVVHVLDPHHNTLFLTPFQML